MPRDTDVDAGSGDDGDSPVSLVTGRRTRDQRSLVGGQGLGCHALTTDLTLGPGRRSPGTSAEGACLEGQSGAERVVGRRGSARWTILE